MQILSRDKLPLGGFAGLREYRLVTDSRIFGARKSPDTFEGLGKFVYLADAQFNPHGETGMHPHKEVDVISVMIDGRVSHEGSLEHGKGLNTGDVQVQRAGGEGFSHNEINPDDTKNRLIQLWVLPEELGQPAGYKFYSPKAKEITRIYGGDKHQTDTFDGSTNIDIVKLEEGSIFQIKKSSLIYLTSGSAEIAENNKSHIVKNGDLIRAEKLDINALTSADLIVISE